MSSRNRPQAEQAKSFRAIHRWARISPRKARLVADMVRGMPVNDAVNVLDRHPKRAAYLFHKVLKSALANASQDLDVDLNSLIVSESRVDEGPLLGGRARWRPRAQGRATPIHKRTSHLRIALSEAPDSTKRRATESPVEQPVETETEGSE
ncbi:MAG: 50S ribosomal protein L22 [Planctomycetota bacterium]|jgi:large subunit ribosomal protein L22